MAAGKTGSLAGVTRHDYLPFGEEVPGDQTWRTPARGYVGDSVRQRFTKKERDAETNLDFFEARYYPSSMGRFTSPDEFTGGPTELFADVAAHNPTFYADLPEPQSLNKYHYALNNPLRYVDPDGHQTTMADKIAECINPPRMWVGNVKAAANVLIDVSNFTAGFIGGEKHERFEPKTCAEGVGMITADRGTLFLSLMGGNPAGVLTAEGETTARVAAEVGEQAAGEARTFQTYTKTNEATGEVYVGRN